MRWLIPAGVVATGLGLLTLYVPLGKGVALIVPPQAPFALVVAGMTSLVVGVIGAWRSRWRHAGGIATGTAIDSKGADEGSSRRLADVIALAGLAMAMVALLAVGSVFVVEPILVSLRPDPCGAAKGVRPPDPACVSAHPEYYQFDPASGDLSTPGSRLAQTLDPVAWPAALMLALGAALISWLALAMGARRRRTALSALFLGSFILVGMLAPYLLFLIGGGD